MRHSAIAIGLCALFASTAGLAQGVSTAAEATAEFDQTMQSGLKAGTQEDAMMCAGYWLGLKEIHAVSTEVPFWRQLPTRLNAETADLGHQCWAAVVREIFKDDSSQLEAAGNRVFEYRQQMIQRVVDAESSGQITGVFSVLGACIPE